MTAFTIINSQGVPLRTVDSDSSDAIDLQIGTGEQAVGVAPSYSARYHFMPDPNDSYWELPPNRYSSWDHVTQTWVADLDAAKEDKWSEVKNYRNVVEFSNFVWSTYEFDGDAESQKRIADAAQDAFMAIYFSSTWSKDWTLADNSTVTLSASNMVAVFQTMRSNIQSAYDTARDLKADIDAATTVAAVEAIVWP